MARYSGPLLCGLPVNHTAGFFSTLFSLPLPCPPYPPPGATTVFFPAAAVHDRQLQARISGAVSFPSRRPLQAETIHLLSLPAYQVWNTKPKEFPQEGSQQRSWSSKEVEDPFEVYVGSQMSQPSCMGALFHDKTNSIPCGVWSTEHSGVCSPHLCTMHIDKQMPDKQSGGGGVPLILCKPHHGHKECW